MTSPNLNAGAPDHPSPWRQPIIWLVVLLVAAAVAGGVITDTGAPAP